MANTSNRSGASRAAAHEADKPAGETIAEAKIDAGATPPAPALDPDSDAGRAAARDAADSAPRRAEDNTDAGRQPDGTASASPAGTDGAHNAEKIEVHTTGNFMLHDPYSLDSVEATGSSRVARTAFIEQKLATGQLKEGPAPKGDKAE